MGWAGGILLPPPFPYKGPSINTDKGGGVNPLITSQNPLLVLILLGYVNVKGESGEEDLLSQRKSMELYTVQEVEVMEVE